MSSEDDDDDDVIVRQLLWRSFAVNDFFLKLDAQAKTQKSSQARRQMKRRVLGPASTRPKPENKNIPSWAFCTSM